MTVSGNPLPVYHSAKVHVMSEKCSTCIFRPGNLMHLQPGRVKEMVEESIKQEAGITCHKTLYGQADQHAVCRGFFDSYADRVSLLRLARGLKMIEEVEE